MTTHRHSIQRVLDAIDGVLPDETPTAPEADPEPKSADPTGPEPLASGDPAEPGLLTTGEVARLFCVDPKTVAGWAKAGKLSTIRTLGGHRRFYGSEVRGRIHGEVR